MLNKKTETQDLLAFIGKVEAFLTSGGAEVDSAGLAAELAEMADRIATVPTGNRPGNWTSMLDSLKNTQDWSSTLSEPAEGKKETRVGRSHMADLLARHYVQEKDCEAVAPQEQGRIETALGEPWTALKGHLENANVPPSRIGAIARYLHAFLQYERAAAVYGTIWVNKEKTPVLPPLEVLLKTADARERAARMVSKEDEKQQKIFSFDALLNMVTVERYARAVHYGQKNEPEQPVRIPTSVIKHCRTGETTPAAAIIIAAVYYSYADRIPKRFTKEMHGRTAFYPLPFDKTTMGLYLREKNIGNAFSDVLDAYNQSIKPSKRWLLSEKVRFGPALSDSRMMLALSQQCVEAFRACLKEDSAKETYIEVDEDKNGVRAIANSIAPEQSLALLSREQMKPFLVPLKEADVKNGNEKEVKERIARAYCEEKMREMPKALDSALLFAQKQYDLKGSDTAQKLVKDASINYNGGQIPIHPAYLFIARHWMDQKPKPEDMGKKYAVSYEELRALWDPSAANQDLQKQSKRFAEARMEAFCCKYCLTIEPVRGETEDRNLPAANWKYTFTAKKGKTAGKPEQEGLAEA